MRTSHPSETIQVPSTKMDHDTPIKSEPMSGTASSSGESSSEQTNVKKTLTASELELRRRRNRESMQRARERERHEIEQMRAQLGVLEHQYKHAVRAQELFLVQYTNPLLANYNDLTQLSQELKQHNFQLQQEVESRRKAYERLERITQDYFVERNANIENNEDDDQMNSASAGVSDFEPITEEQACELIRQCCQEVSHFEKSNIATVSSDYACFGWTRKHQIVNDSRILFLLSKTFSHIHPLETMDKAWELYSRQEANTLNTVRVLRLEVLQDINEDTQVMVRDIAHPLDKGVILRTIMLRFRIKTERGYVGGRISINPTTPPPDQNLRYADLTTFTEFGYLDPSKPNLPGCQVKFGGSVDYHTKRELSGRFLNILATTLRMEQSLMQPLQRLLPCTD